MRVAAPLLTREEVIMNNEAGYELWRYAVLCVYRVLQSAAPSRLWLLNKQ